MYRSDITLQKENVFVCVCSTWPRERDLFSFPSLLSFSNFILSFSLLLIFFFLPFRALSLSFFLSLSLSLSLCIATLSSFSSPSHDFSFVVVFVVGFLRFFFFRFFLPVFLPNSELDDRRRRPLRRGTRSHGRSEVVITSSSFPTC